MNARTEKLIDYVNVIKQRNRKREKADKLKLKMAQNSADVQNAIEEEEMVYFIFPFLGPLRWSILNNLDVSRYRPPKT